MITKIIHQIWVGPYERPEVWMKTWKEKHPTWEYILWGEDRIDEFKNKDLIKKCIEEKKYHGAADIMKYEILYNYGGFIAPADSECLNPIDELLNIDEDCFACYENEEMRPGLVSPQIGATKGNKLMEVMIDKMSKLTRVVEPWINTGNVVFTKTIEELKYPIRLYPSHYFIPEHFGGYKYQGQDRVYATHKWWTSKKLWK
jgi:mannosyltransferase OCH1-like enzyme